MKLLIDTHIWLWSLLEPKRLSGRVTRSLLKPANEIWLSPISAWEVLVLCRKGRLVLQPNASGWISAAFERSPLREAPITHDVVMAMEKVVLPHRDPADCFLAASAQVYGLTLVTADENLLGGTGYAVLANR
jgi:PIN domain nuclease of toxin-antitoxin system